MQDYAKPVSWVSASVQLGDGVRMYEISTDGVLHFLKGVDVHEQGKLLATSVDGSTLSITTGNGDNESFDVEVLGSTGYNYGYRIPYSEDRHFKIVRP